MKTERERERERERGEEGKRREKREREGRDFNFSLRSTECRRSVFVELRTKVHRIDKMYAWVPKNRDFTENPSGGDFGKSRLLGLGGFLPVDHAPRCKRFFLHWLIFHLRVVFGLG